jgi:hypothetical protein
MLDASLSPSLGSIPEDTLAPTGRFISSLIAGAITGGNSTLQGIAVTSASSLNGTWQFQLSGGSWEPMGLVAESHARLLPETAKVRFIPNADFNGTVRLYYRAWDPSVGSAGQVFDASHGGGAFSIQYDVAPLVVTPVNDKPVLTLSGSLGYKHDSAAVALAPFAGVADVDSDDFAGGRLRVRITDGASTSNRLTIGSGFTVDANNNVLQGTTIIGKRVCNSSSGPSASRPSAARLASGRWCLPSATATGASAPRCSKRLT